MSKIVKKIVYKIALIAIWLVVIFLFSNQVATDSSMLSARIVDFVSSYTPSIMVDSLTFVVRKSAHVFLYFVLGLLVYSLLKEYRLNEYKRALYGTLFVFLYAITDEVHQTFVPGRSGEVGDVVLDTLAGLAGIMIFMLVKKSDKTR